MKILGHVYVAVRSFPHADKNKLVIGALLPELVFYLKDPIFDYNTLHEGGRGLYKFLKSKYPDWTDVAIGILSHGYGYGVDGIFNKPIYLKKLGYKQSDLKEIAYALKIPERRAVGRVHNVYSLVIDRILAVHHPSVLKVIENSKKINLDKLVSILSKYYHLNSEQVYQNVNHIWEDYDFERFNDFTYLAKSWQKMARYLKEPDPVDIQKTSKLLEKFYSKAKPAIPDVLDNVIRTTKKNVENVVNNL
jgi:virulence-associated protein VapD